MWTSRSRGRLANWLLRLLVTWSKDHLCLIILFPALVTQIFVMLLLRIVMILRFLMIVNCRSLVMARISVIWWNCLVFPYNLLCSSFLVMFPFHYWMWKFFLSLLTHFSPHLSQFLTSLSYFARFSKEWCNLSKKTPLPHYLQGGSMFLTVCGLIAMALTPSSTFPTSPRSLITGRLPSLNHFGGMREM